MGTPPKADKITGEEGVVQTKIIDCKKRNFDYYKLTH